jgi:hypothetical protein
MCNGGLGPILSIESGGLILNPAAMLHDQLLSGQQGCLASLTPTLCIRIKVAGHARVDRLHTFIWQCIPNLFIWQCISKITAVYSALVLSRWYAACTLMGESQPDIMTAVLSSC